MPREVQRGRPRQEPPPPENQGATTAPDGVILPEPPLYILLMQTRYGGGRRLPFLSLHSAVKAAKRARERGLAAELVLCRLEPVTADLDLDGGDHE